jgi:hypothetical protein
MVHTIASILRSVQLAVQHEVPFEDLGPLSALNGSGSGRMDLVVTSSDLQTLLADVTITHPSPSGTISQTMQTPLYFAKYQESRKIRRYGDIARQMGHTFAPLALETYGATGPALNRYLRSLANRHQHLVSRNSEEDSLEKSTLIRYWRTKISCCLQRANAKLLIGKSNRIAATLRQGSPPNTPDLSEAWYIT